jgi:murein DD-endopeptidase MepM/ murein hydrolase activator NlpD
MLLSATFAASSTGVALAISSTGGTLAPPAVAAGPVGTARSGGTGAAASTAANTGGSGGAAAPSTKGTGGSEYGVLAPKPKVTRKLAPRKPSHTVRRPRATPKPKAKPPTPAVSEAGVPSPAQTAGEGAVFPVLGLHSFGDAANRFGAGRVGHIHEGQDVLASEGLTVVAPLAGTIITTAYQAGGAGWYAAEHTVDGLDFFYAHCQAGSLAVSTGQAVSAGQAICQVGQTGDATGPHLHFEVWVGGWQAAGGYPIDPLPYLEEWDHVPGG